jgi:DNA-binding transcriptional MerR regulator
VTYTAGQLAKRCGLSRTALLYYESIGLMKAAGRSSNNYRRYSEKDRQRLEQICRYRESGLSLEDIKGMLDRPSTDGRSILERRLAALNEEIRKLRDHQRSILSLLRNPAAFRKAGIMSKDAWVALLRNCGFSDADMSRWHAEFERSAPAEHQHFLEYLCIPEGEIRSIRAWSRKQLANDTSERAAG